MSKGDERIKELVEKFGWSVLTVPDDAMGPGFSYSIGLFQNFSHPEVFISGLPQDKAQSIINYIGELVREGQRFVEELESSDILVDASCLFKPIDKKCYEDYLGTAIRFYRHKEFPALQCYWPDEKGYYPFQQEASDWLKERQEQLHNQAAV